MKGITIILTLIMTFSIQAQETRTPNGIYDERHNSYALTHGTIYKDHATRLEDATLVFRDGLIVSIKAGGEVPAGFVEIDLGGRFVYPGLIDLNTSYGLPEPAKTPALAYSSKEILATTNHGAYNANESIKSHYNAVDHFKVDKKAGETLRKLGFSTVLSLSADGIARGTSSLVTLGNELANDAVLEDKAAAHYSFTKGSSKQFYPISRMGSVALLRQTHLDAEWYGNLDKPPFRDLSLEGWNNSQSLPQIFESTNWKTAILADSVGDEHSVQYIINGSGDEYQRLNLLKATDASFIIPVNFPAAYEVDDPIDTERITLSEMKHWELAPYNPARLTEADIEFAITSKESGKDFWENLRKAVNNGLSKPRAIAALTTVPATLLGKADQIGSLAPGRLANFIITSGDIFEKKSKINENWIRGKKYVINEFAPDFTGNYRLTVADQQFHLKITGETGKYKVKLKDEAEDAPGEVEEDKQSNDKQPNKKPGSKVSISKDLISLSLVH